MLTHRLAAITAIALASALVATSQRAPVPRENLPRTADGKPNLQGIWQASSTAAADLQDHSARIQHAGRAVRGRRRRNPVSALGRREEGRELSKSPEGRSAQQMLHARRSSDHVSGFPVSDLPDAPGHCDDLRMVAGLSPDPYRRQSAPRRHRFLDGRFARPLGGRHAGGGRQPTTTTKPGSTWRGFSQRRAPRGRAIPHDRPRHDRVRSDHRRRESFHQAVDHPTSPLRRRTDRDRLFEYVCQAEAEEANGAFTREERTWYPGNGTPPPAMPSSRSAASARDSGERRRRTFAGRPDGKPDLQGFYVPDAGGANYGLEKRAAQRRSRRPDEA